MHYIRHFFFLGLLLAQHGFCAVSFLTLSDIHYGSDNNSLPGNDTGTVLLNSSMLKVKELSRSVDFILVLGDLPTHLQGYSPKKAAYEDKVFSVLYKADVYKKPMFYITGNNDSLKGNYQPFEYKGMSPLTYAKDWGRACLYCKDLIIDASHMNSGGYYSSHVIQGNKDILLIALNTVQWTRSPLFLNRYQNQDRDAQEQLRWFEQQLKTHQAKQLLIAMHIPPGASFIGFNFWYSPYLRQFISLLKQYHPRYEEITLLTSHTHSEEFRRIASGNKNIYAVSTPSISRVYANNPALKVFELDGAMKIKNFTTFFTTDHRSWGDEHYTAMGTEHSIFPWCKGVLLVDCLNELSAEKICHRMRVGAFSGVKNKDVGPNEKICQGMYKVDV